MKISPIPMVVRYPATEDGWRELRCRVAQVHADSVVSSISKLAHSVEQQEALRKAVITYVKIQADKSP